LLNEEHRILVTDAERGSAVSIIRSLGRRGWRVFPAASRADSPGFRSRLASEPVLYPSPRSDPDAFVAAIIEAVRRLGIELVIPVSDEAILPLVTARERVERECRLALPSSRALETAHDKLATFELAAKLGVETPRTRVVRTVAEALRLQPGLGWPVVLKPRWSRVLDGSRIEAFEVSYASDEAELAARMQHFAGRCDILLQEYCPGRGCGIELLLDRGRPVAAFQHVRIRELPVTGGASCLRASAPLDPALLRYATQLLAAVDWTGLAMVEFKVGPGGPVLMEINGRVWGSLPLAVRAGVDFPRLLGELYLGGGSSGNAGPSGDYTVGLRGRDLGLDLLWIGSVLLQRRRHFDLPFPPRRRGLSALCGLLDPTIRPDVLSLTDPLPGLSELALIARNLRSKLTKELPA
jgi:predicted ATP-grasp superfamily ATP-dependent carboligase